MAVKTITIDMEAYEMLSKTRTGSESFSTIIKRVLGPAGKNAQTLLANLDTLRVSPSFLDDVEKVVRSRNDDLLAAQPVAASRE